MQELTNIEKLERNKRVAKKIGRGTLHVLRFLAGAAGSVSISYGNNRSDDDWDYDKLSAKQKHNMDSNGLSRAEAIRWPDW